MQSLPATSQPTALSRAWYTSSINAFLNGSPESVLAELAAKSDFDILTTQRNTWITQIEILREHLNGLTGWLSLEFNIPRMGRRIDVVLLIGSIVFVIEFKIGEKTFDRVAIDQVWDYALDLKNFHKASHAASIVPILIATQATTSNTPFQFDAYSDNVYRPIKINVDNLRPVIDRTLQAVNGSPLDHQLWSCAPYHPTPTIVEAARSLYAQHSVDAIACYDAGKKNLRDTSRRVEELISEARKNHCKIICFVTGVPGAGKTLIGLNVATKHRKAEEPTYAVFLSGNAPLVAVLHEALTRDELVRQKRITKKIRKKEVGKSVKAFIQNIHHFRDEGIKDPAAPIEHVVIFDEAQRAWNEKQTSSFMQRKKGLKGFKHSEPGFLISCMDRHKDWAVIVCLVGGGQEINTGEAGIDAWLEAVNTSFPHWQMYISSKLTDTEYAAGKALEDIKQRQHAHFDDSLHLAVSNRSFRAENVSTFVKALLDSDRREARESYIKLSDRFPIAVTRDLQTAKDWVRAHARGSERFGMMASSKAQRLKPHAIDIRVDVNPVHWFLNEKEDTRSSYYLEDAATEFQVQGLELDWACVTWDGDLRATSGGWSFHDFRGTKWCNISKPENRSYLKNAYRVLLTRARQGMVIFIPPGDSSDPTRSPNFYDPTFDYLVELGLPVIN